MARKICHKDVFLKAESSSLKHFILKSQLVKLTEVQKMQTFSGNP